MDRERAVEAPEVEHAMTRSNASEAPAPAPAPAEDVTSNGGQPSTNTKNNTDQDNAATATMYIDMGGTSSSSRSNAKVSDSSLSPDEIELELPSRRLRRGCMAALRCLTVPLGDCMKLVVQGTWLQILFYHLGLKVARNPRYTIILSLLFVCLCSIGFINFQSETDDNRLFTPQKSQAYDDKSFVDKYWPTTRVGQPYYAVAADNDKSNILTNERLLSLWQAGMSVITAGNNDPNATSYDEICVKIPDTNQCYIESILSVWKFDPTAIAEDEDVVQTINDAIALELESNTESRLLRLLGGIKYDDNDGDDDTDSDATIVSAAATMMTTAVTVRDISDVFNKDESSEQENPISVIQDWELQVLDLTLNYTKEDNPVDIYMDSFFALDAAATSTLSKDIWKLIVGFALLIGYGAIVMSRSNFVDSQSVMALWSVVSVLLAIAASFGLASAFGVKYNDVTSSLIFVAAGIGMDDAFVIMRNYVRVDPHRELDIETRIAKAMASGGASIFITSMTDFVVFMTGVISTLPVIQDFSIYAGMAILFDLILQATFFVGVLALDARRQQANRAECCLAFHKPKDPNGRHCFASCNKTEYKSTDLGPLDYFVGEIMPPIILSRIGKVVILLASIVLGGLSIYGAIQLRSDFNYEWFIDSSSPVNDVFEIRDEWFGVQGEGRSFGIYTREGNYSSQWGELESISNALQDEYWIDASRVYFWFDGYKEWLSENDASAEQCSVDRVLAESPNVENPLFYSCLQSYLNTSAGREYQSDIQWRNNSTIFSTRIRAAFEGTETDEEQVKAMDASREIARIGGSFSTISFTFGFIYLEGSKVIRWQTVRSLIISSAFVCVVTLALLMNVMGSLIVFVHVALVDVALLAILWLAGYSFNMITSIVIVLAVGLSVDYSTHVVYAFLEAKGSDRNDRVQTAMRHIGSTVLNGGFTTWLSISVLATAKSYVFKVFFISFTVIVVFALLYGLLLIPVLLSLIGPKNPMTDMPSMDGKNHAFEHDDAKTNTDKGAISLSKIDSNTHHHHGDQ